MYIYRDELFRRRYSVRTPYALVTLAIHIKKCFKGALTKRIKATPFIEHVQTKWLCVGTFVLDADYRRLKTITMCYSYVRYRMDGWFCMKR